MTTASKQAPKTATREPREVNLLASDSLVYVTLVLLVWGTWQVSKIGLFKAGDDLGYWIGVAGGVMMLLLFSYPLRKHFKFAQGWGKVKFWFWFHMVLGVGGPLLILLHSTFHIGSLNAGVALYSMLIVAGSGVVGRFIYSRIHRGLRGEMTDLKQLQSLAGLDQEEARSRLSFAPKVEEMLKAFELAETSARPGWPTHLRRVFWMPVQQWLLFRRCKAELKQPLRRLAKQNQWSQQEYAKRRNQAYRLVQRFINAVVRVAQFSAFERVFSLWHIAHIPFVYLLIISAIVHVVAVHAY
jgi:hypothetical protein